MGLQIVDFRAHSKNTLKGFITLRFTTVGLELRDIALHERNGKRWLQLPAKDFIKPDGTKGWNYILAFYEKPKYYQFQELALEALDAYLREAKGNGNDNQP